MFKKAASLTRPTPARQDAPFHGRPQRVRGAKNNERDARTKLGEKHVSARLGWAGEKGAIFQHPVE